MYHDHLLTPGHLLSPDRLGRTGNSPEPILYGECHADLHDVPWPGIEAATDAEILDRLETITVAVYAGRRERIDPAVWRGDLVERDELIEVARERGLDTAAAVEVARERMRDAEAWEARIASGEEEIAK